LQDFKPIQKISSSLYGPTRQSGAFVPRGGAALGIAGSGDKEQELLA
jgi:hypothetical protein